jgi:hypothetical protein
MDLEVEAMPTNSTPGRQRSLVEPFDQFFDRLDPSGMGVRDEYGLKRFAGALDISLFIEECEDEFCIGSSTGGQELTSNGVFFWIRSSCNWDI